MEVITCIPHTESVYMQYLLPMLHISPLLVPLQVVLPLMASLSSPYFPLFCQYPTHQNITPSILPSTLMKEHAAQSGSDLAGLVRIPTFPSFLTFSTKSTFAAFALACFSSASLEASRLACLESIMISRRITL